MKKKTTLKTIIEYVLDDKNISYNKTDDATVKSLSRAFYKFIEKLGSDKEMLKCGGHNYEFVESEVPFMKIIISQLYDNKGIIAEFTNGRKGNKVFSSKDVYDLIESLGKEADKVGVNENEIERMVDFFSKIFLLSPLRSVEYCHELIDAFALTLQDLTYDEQSIYLRQLEYVLKKELGLRYAEFCMKTLGLAHYVEEYRKKNGCSLEAGMYYEYEPELRFYYIQRDRAVLEAIQEDDDLRQFIEKKFGKKAEEIFNYAVLDTSNKSE